MLDYGRISRRWCMPARYYARSYGLDGGASLKVVYIDTAPLIDNTAGRADPIPMSLPRI